MVEAKSLNVQMLEHTIESWIEGGPLHAQVPMPDAALLHQLARWAKVYAIWATHDAPVAAAVNVFASQYIAQHYGLLVNFRSLLDQPGQPVETDETCFNLAIDCGLEIFKGTKPEPAVQQILTKFAANKDAFRRAAGSAPRHDWQHYWSMYKLLLV